eukprot:453524_1
MKLCTNNKYILGIIPIIIGIILYTSGGILTRLSMLNENHLPYNTNAVMIIVEFGKFVVSFISLVTSEGIYKGIKLLRSVSLNERLIFCIPAIIYSITNNLTFYELQYMDPATSSVLSQTKIIGTAFLWWYVFQKHLNKQKIISLLLLTCGSILVALPNNNVNQMYILWPAGPSLKVVNVVLKCISCILTEWIYKKYGKNRSMHVDNLSMYFWGVLANLFQYYCTKKDVGGKLSITLKYLINEFNIYTYLLIVVNVAQGLCISFILKYFNNIVKLMMFAASIVLIGVLTYIIFDLNWTVTYSTGLFVVIVALLLYRGVISNGLLKYIAVAFLLISFNYIIVHDQYTYFNYFVHHSAATTNNTISSSYPNIAVVGNGPLKETDYEQINNCDIVYRFKSCNNYRKGDKVTHLALRQEGTTTRIMGLIGACTKYKNISNIIFIGQNKTVFHQYKNANLDKNMVMIHLDKNFKQNATINFNGNKIIKPATVWGASTGFYLLSYIYKGQPLHIFGMNWHVHAEHPGLWEKNMIQTYCNQCTIHPTKSNLHHEKEWNFRENKLKTKRKRAKRRDRREFAERDNKLII